MNVLNKDAFRAIIASLTGLSDGATVWELDPQPYIGDQDRAKVYLQLFSMEALGVDEHRRAFNPGGYPPGSFVTTEIGNRTLKITIRAEVFDRGQEASELIDLIRTGIRAEAVTAKLNAINLAYVWSEQATNLRTRVDTRMVNAAVADFTFAGIASQVSDRQGDYILTVNGNNQIPGTVTVDP